MKARIDGAWPEVTGGRVRISGQWRTLISAQAYISGAWREAVSFVQPLSVSIDPIEVSGFIVGEGTVTTATVNATPTGGIAPYTYSWARVGAGSGEPDSPTTAGTRFNRYVNLGEVSSETFRVTVTSAGQTATADVSATFTSIDLGL
jgi:hypothetical protein